MKIGKTIGGVAALSATAILAWALFLREPAGSQQIAPAGAEASPKSTAPTASRHIDQDAARKKAVRAPATGDHSEDRREHYAAQAESLQRRAAELREHSEHKATIATVAVADGSTTTSPDTQKKSRTTAERHALASSTHGQVLERLGPHMDRMGLAAQDQERAVATVANLRNETKTLTLRDSLSMAAPDVVARLVELRKNAEQELAGFIGPEKAASILLIENSTHLRQTMVADVAAQCAASGVPLSDETADRIAALCLQHSVLLHPSPGDDTLLIEEVKSILQPAQLTHLKERLAKRYDGK